MHVFIFTLIVNPFKDIMRETIIVTGSARGIGRSVTESLLESGYSVIAIDLLKMEDSDVITRRKENLFSMSGDVSNDFLIENLKNIVKEADLKIIGLVNNAFAMVLKPFLELSDQDWEFTMKNSFLNSVKITRAVIPMMIDQKKGSIINISSAHAFGSVRSFSAYEAAKGAINALTRALSVEFGKLGIRTNTVAPGLIITERNHQRWFGNQHDFHNVKVAYPLRRAGTPSEVANVVRFLLSDESSFVSGSTILVDGGLTANLPENAALDLVEEGYMSNIDLD